MIILLAILYVGISRVGEAAVSSSVSAAPVNPENLENKVDLGHFV